MRSALVIAACVVVVLAASAAPARALAVAPDAREARARGAIAEAARTSAQTEARENCRVADAHTGPRANTESGARREARPAHPRRGAASQAHAPDSVLIGARGVL